MTLYIIQLSVLLQYLSHNKLEENNYIQLHLLVQHDFLNAQLVSNICTGCSHNVMVRVPSVQTVNTVVVDLVSN